jgi:hypothetical protein
MAHVYRSPEDHNRILSKVAAYAARYLAPEFTYTPPTEGGYQHKLVGSNEATLYLSLEGDTKGDRIIVSGGFHIGTISFGGYGAYVRPNSGVPSDISVALARGEAAVAMEIRRRYLPVYLVALAEARAQRDADTAYIVKQQATLSRLALVAGNRTPDLQCAGSGRSHTVSLSIGEIYGDIEAYGDSVTLKLRSMTLAQAEAVLKLLKGGL